ncbi:ligand-binding sensor domain-containing protein [Dysgonomonas macrotermitis]|uniref:Uncharacterized protein n=1 Tax=Dysgonomonas macrotermitis TaxID=1346286 RepID=A0A1M4TGY0_9BACT|nr:hypothetical protein [Dysgonomonas macrotermitis]SHE43711.1 hypothetical protein SAMN05444362_101325 [Dysgonomonas macrotermitis]
MRKYFFILSLILLLFSCAKHEEINTIGETEYYFDEKLSSISPDNDGSFWVGSETGDLFNFKDNYRVLFDLGEDRIYKVNREIVNPGDTLFWIAIRNSGLQKWRKNANEELKKLKTYNINYKQNQYSPYDFLTIGETMYVATSQGVYYLDKNSDADSLSLIFPSTEFLAKQDGTTFVVHNICQYNDSLLLASTQDGLLWYNRLTHKTRITFKNNYIEHVSVYNDTIFTVAKDHLYLNNIHGDTLTQIETGYGPKQYYRMQGIHYLVGAEDLLLSNDLKNFFNIRLKRSIPMGCRNLILPDTLNNFTYLLTDNAVWRISNNIDIFKSNKAIKASCSNSRNIYYLSFKNELFVQDRQTNEAKWIYTFPEDNLIQWMDIVNNDLYLYNIDNEFQKIIISDNWIKNVIFNSPKTILRSEARITAASIKQMNGKNLSFLGIQDGLIKINPDNKIDTIHELSKAYITSMFGHADADRLYISTLNNGVFYIDRDNLVRHIPQTEKTSFIKDIITTNSHNSNLIILTNQHIISQYPNDSVRVKGYKKLLYANDTLFYALPEFGIHKFIISGNQIIDKGIFYKDIRFNRNSSFSTANKLVLVSNIGSLYLSTNQEQVPVWIHFEDAINIDIIRSVLLTLIIALLVGLTIIIIVKKHNANIVQIRKRKEDLIKRVDDLIFHYSILEDTENPEVSGLKNIIESIDIDDKNKKDINARLEELSLQIAKLNRGIALLIPKKLDQQIEQIKEIESFETSLLLRLSQEAKTKNDLDMIKDRIRSNEIWLQEATSLSDSLQTDIDTLSGSIEIEGLNKNMLINLLSIKENIKHKPLSDLTNEYNVIKNKILEIDTEHSTGIISKYISDTDIYLMEKTSQDKGLLFLSDTLQKVKMMQPGQNTELLKRLKPLDDQLRILQTLDEIKSQASMYKETHDQIVKDNNNQINKKFDKELASFISDNTQTITRSVNTLIATLYSYLLKTDKHIVIDILKLTNPEGQHAKVLALLIADLKIKRSLIPGMLGIYGNLNPVISRLVNERIKVNETSLRSTQKSNKEKSVFVHLILKLLE